MLKNFRNFLLVAAAGCLSLAQPSMAAEGINGNLVTGNWLKNNLANPSVLILDTSPAKLYAAQHIPGAINIDLLSYGVQEVPVAEMEKRYQSWGVSPGKKIVMYDQAGTGAATRLFFELYYHGFPVQDLLILDGAIYKWQEAGLPVTKDMTPAPKNGSFKIEKSNEEVRVMLPEFLTASGDPANNALVEALGADWHFGEVAVFDRAGHIPNGILLPSADFYNPDQTFKSADEIRKMLAYSGVKPEQQIYTYCGGGIAASVPFFALKFLVKYPKVKLYSESEIGWLSDERQLPYWTYDAPFLMRDTNWLKSWGGMMMKMYAGAQVTIVDVRPADAFNQGHVPFALSVPAAVFRSHLTDPAELAKILGPAGVNASHEAVVVSGAGLTKDAALAFVMLEKLGQKKVSVFMDGMDSVEAIDKLAQRGFALTKNGTTLVTKKTPDDLSVPRTPYIGSVRKDVVIADPTSTQGVYPKVFIASGGSVPTKAPDGKVVHVPYTDLLNADGTPKAAKDIWNILAKAGVPRYAELVFFSDDPGEAAANYFVLKLMGYPDIKVWAI